MNSRRLGSKGPGAERNARDGKPRAKTGNFSGSGEAYQTLPFVRPGGEILLKIEGWPKVEQVLRHIDAVEALGIDACDVAPDHWRHVGNRIGAGHEPRAYTPERHAAWLKRREIAP